MTFENIVVTLEGEETPLPKTVKILHKTFALRERGYNESFGNHRLAEINFMNNEINYLPLDNSEVVDSIIHELLHGLFHMFAIGLNEEAEEQVVTALATGITTVMLDNPDLFYSLQDMLVDD